MLIGFTIVAAPLLFAIVNAAVQMNRLSTRSEQLVVHGVQGTRNNQRMFEEIGALERTARLYQIIGSADLLEVYARNQQRLVGTLDELLSLPLDAESREDALALQAEAERLHVRTEAQRTELGAHGGPDQFLSADLGPGIQGVEPRQRANRPRIEQACSARRSSRSRICSGRRCCSCP